MVHPGCRLKEQSHYRRILDGTRGTQTPHASQIRRRSLLQADKVTKARAELLRRHGDGGGQSVELGDILKIRVFESNHVVARALVRFTLHIDFADLETARVRVEHLLELQRNHFAVLKADDGAEFSRLR